jgi:hypothetical protein
MRAAGPPPAGKRRAVLALVSALIASGASAYAPERARAYFAQELAECGAWFELVAEAPGLDKATQVAFGAAGVSLISTSADLTSEAWALARADEASRRIRAEMRGSWRKFSAVDAVYGKRCRDVYADPVARRRYWVDKRD